MPPADLILTNARVITLDARDTIAEAIAIAGDKILAVGPAAAMAQHTAPTTRVIDLAGRAVIPGLIDGHAHMDREALRGIFPTLAGARSVAEIQERIAELARGKAPGEWIVTMPIGEPPYYLDLPDSLAEGRWPTRHDLDKAAPRNPVYIRSIWGYWRGAPPLVSIANTAALQRARIGRDTISPVPSLVIDKDAAGEPTGVFIEDEMQPLAELLWFRDVARFTPADRLATLPQSARLYHSFGTTSVYEGHGVAAELMRAYTATHREGRLTMRTTLTLSPSWPAVGNAALGPFVTSWLSWLGHPGLGDDMLKMGGIHVHVGRSAGDDARAAASPYTGWAGFNYDHGLPHDKARELLIHCAANDIRVTAITGGGALGMLDLYEDVDRQVSLKGRRWVLSHISVIPPNDIERIARLGVVLTTHSNNYLFKGLPALAARLPREQHEDIVPLNALREAGVKVSLATDNVPISLFSPIRQVVTRRNMKTGDIIGAGQALSRMEALRCATANGAWLTFDEDRKGTLELGKYADLAVLDADPLTVPEPDIAAIRSVLTLVGGRIVHEAR
jgi:predicted amidohydrolase YtcJ